MSTRRRFQVLVGLLALSLFACGGGDGDSGQDVTNTVDEGGEDTTVVVDEGSASTGWTEIEAIFNSCAGCHTGGNCTGGNCFLNDYESAVAAPSGPSCGGHATSIECGLARAKDGTMPLGGCAQPPCISDAETVEAWIADGMPE